MTSTPPDGQEIRLLLVQVVDELARVRHELEQMRAAEEEHMRVQEARLATLEWRNEDLQAQLRIQVELNQAQQETILRLVRREMS